MKLSRPSGNGARRGGPVAIRPSFPALSALALLLGVVVTGCGPMVGARPGPEPSPPLEPPPVLETPPVFPVEEEPVPIVVPEPIPVAIVLDPILDSPWARTPAMEARVQEWIESMQGREATLFRTSLARMGRYGGIVEEELRQGDLPPSLLYLPIVESWYNPKAYSRAGASGLWQFMPPTARGMGLRVDSFVDERRDPLLSTPQALAYLSQLNNQFGSWFLALAAYNAGPGRVERVLRRRGQGSEGHDGLFLEILSDLPSETRDFVPRFLAAARIAMDPVAYGFQDVLPEDPFRFDEVEVPDALSLDVMARAASLDQKELEEMNPQLLRGVTPFGAATRLRVPEGAGARSAEAIRSIPPEERVSFLEHAVARGETLTHVARLYGVSVNDLQAANPSIQPRRMQIGQRVVVPRSPSAASRVGQGGSLLAGAGGVTIYSVRAGDTLSGIAARHRVRVGDLLQWNGLSRDAIIRPGDEVRIHLPGR
jgi:membrane-bound lytic murein transglycosylase D